MTAASVPAAVSPAVAARAFGASVQPLRYEDVPQRAAVVRNGDFVELIIPTRPAWRLWAVRQTIVGTLGILVIVGIWVPFLLLAPWFNWGLAVFLALFFILFAGGTLRRLLMAPRETILRWDGQTLTAPAFTIGAGKDRTFGDSPKWSRGAIADIQARPLWPGRLTGCGTVKIVSRYDYSLHLAVYPQKELEAAVAEFRGIVLGDDAETSGT